MSQGDARKVETFVEEPDALGDRSGERHVVWEIQIPDDHQPLGPDPISSGLRSGWLRHRRFDGLNQREGIDRFGLRRRFLNGFGSHLHDLSDDWLSHWFLRRLVGRLSEQARGWLLGLLRRLFLRRLSRGRHLDRPYRDHIHVQSLTMEMEAIVFTEVRKPDGELEREHLG
ncbi:MAG: hypothetical protein ACHRXM_00035 [Isosphaerales bacterium]